jgi:predicted membrane chloride channel (bestrophin family)
MIVRQQIKLSTVLFSFRLSILTKVWPRVALATVIATVVTVLHLRGVPLDVLSVTPF